MRAWILAGALALAVAQGAHADDFESSVLNAHNAIRAEHFFLHMPRLHWDPALAKDAACWAQHEADIGQMIHSTPSDSCNAFGAPYGENLYNAWPPGSMTPAQMVQKWGEEEADFKAGVFPDVATDGQAWRVEHYTQIMWSTTSAVGCGLATGNGKDFLVCRYSPQGNINGAPVQ